MPSMLGQGYFPMEIAGPMPDMLRPVEVVGPMRFMSRMWFALSISMLVCLYVTVEQPPFIIDVFKTMDKTALMKQFTVFTSTVMPLESVKNMHKSMPAYARYAEGKNSVLAYGNSTMCGDKIIFLDIQYTNVINDICLGAKIANMFYPEKQLFCERISSDMTAFRSEVNSKCDKLLDLRCPAMEVLQSNEGMVESALYAAGAVVTSGMWYGVYWFVTQG